MVLVAHAQHKQRRQIRFQFRCHSERSDDPVTMYLSDIYTIAVNLAGLPGMSVPAGLVDGRPTGLQIIGNYFDEARLLNVAHKYQQATDWHSQIPAEFA